MSVTTIPQGIEEYVKTYSGLTSELVLVNSLSAEPVQFSIVPLPGAKVLEWYISGGSLREYPFALQAMFHTTDDATRIANYGFYEGFSAWVETQEESGTLPEMPSGSTAENIEVTDLPILFQQGESETGIYQVSCKLTYSKE